MPSETDFGQEPARPLSRRELAVLRELTTGAGSREIARALGIAEAAVHMHLKNLLKKIGVQNRTQAAWWAVKNGIVEARPSEREPTV